MWQHASILEARRLLFAGATAEVVLVVGGFAFPGESMPISVRAVGPVLATALDGRDALPVPVFAVRRSSSRGPGLRGRGGGCGRAGGSDHPRDAAQRPPGPLAVAVVDDDDRWWKRSLNNVIIEGGIDDLERVVEEHDAHQVLLVIPSGGTDVARRVAEHAAAAGVPVKVLPSMAELIGDRPSLRDAGDLSIDDLMSRDQVDIDFGEVANLLRGVGSSSPAEAARSEPRSRGRVVRPRRGGPGRSRRDAPVRGVSVGARGRAGAHRHP